MKSYSEMLKHPLWQKKRLEILAEHDFTCELCDDKETSLHVHHGYYEKGRMPWEYPDESLHCLCEKCHLQVQKSNTELLRLIGYLPLDELEMLRGFVSTRLAICSISHKISAGDDNAGYVICGMVLGSNLMDERFGWGDQYTAPFIKEIRDGVITHNGVDYEVAWVDRQTANAKKEGRDNAQAGH